MIANHETGRLVCDFCGTDLVDANGPMAAEEGTGSLLCLRCQGRSEGYDEGQLELSEQFARAAIFELVNAHYGDIAAARGEVLAIIERAARIIEHRRTVGAPTALGADDELPFGIEGSH
jgi:hypothetical protein